MTVVADVDADGRVLGLEDRVAKVAGLEEVLLPEAGRVRQVVFAVRAEERAIGVEDRGGVVVDAGLRAFVERHYDDHIVLLGILGQAIAGGAGHGLCRLVPARVLAGAEVWTVEDLLQAEDLHASLASLFDERDVFFEHRRLDLGDGASLVVNRVGALDQATLQDSCHVLPLGSQSQRVIKTLRSV